MFPTFEINVSQIFVFTACLWKEMGELIGLDHCSEIPAFKKMSQIYEFNLLHLGEHPKFEEETNQNAQNLLVKITFQTSRRLMKLSAAESLSACTLCRGSDRMKRRK